MVLVYRTSHGVFTPLLLSFRSAVPEEVLCGPEEGPPDWDYPDDDDDVVRIHFPSL